MGPEHLSNEPVKNTLMDLANEPNEDISVKPALQAIEDEEEFKAKLKEIGGNIEELKAEAKRRLEQSRLFHQDRNKLHEQALEQGNEELRKEAEDLMKRSDRKDAEVRMIEDHIKELKEEAAQKQGAAAEEKPKEAAPEVAGAGVLEGLALPEEASWNLRELNDLELTIVRQKAANLQNEIGRRIKRLLPEGRTADKIDLPDFFKTDEEKKLVREVIEFEKAVTAEEKRRERKEKIDKAVNAVKDTDFYTRVVVGKPVAADKSIRGMGKEDRALGMLGKIGKAINGIVLAVKAVFTTFLKGNPKPAQPKPAAPIVPEKKPEPVISPEPAVTAEIEPVPVETAESQPAEEPAVEPAIEPAAQPIAEKKPEAEEPPKPKKKVSDRDAYAAKMVPAFEKHEAVKKPEKKTEKKAQKKTKETAAEEKTASPQAPEKISRYADFDISAHLTHEFSEFLTKHEKHLDWIQSGDKEAIGARFEAFEALKPTIEAIKAGYGQLVEREVTGGKYSVVKKEGLGSIDAHLTDLALQNPGSAEEKGSFLYYARLAREFVELPKKNEEREKQLSEYRTKHNIPADKQPEEFAAVLSGKIAKLKNEAAKREAYKEYAVTVLKYYEKGFFSRIFNQPIEARSKLREQKVALDPKSIDNFHKRLSEINDKIQQAVNETAGDLSKTEELVQLKKDQETARAEFLNESFEPFKMFSKHVQERIRDIFQNPAEFKPAGTSRVEAMNELVNMHEKYSKASTPSTIDYSKLVSKEDIDKIDDVVEQLVTEETADIIRKNIKGKTHFTKLAEDLKGFLSAKQFGSKKGKEAEEYKRKVLEAYAKNVDEFKKDKATILMLNLIIAGLI